MLSWDTLECEMNGVLAEDAQTNRTLFGGSARVSKEGGRSQDLADSTRRLAINARMESTIPCISRWTPSVTKGGQTRVYRAEETSRGRLWVRHPGLGFAFTGRCYTLTNCIPSCDNPAESRCFSTSHIFALSRFHRLEL